MSEYYSYRTGIVGTVHIKHSVFGSYVMKGISPLNFVEKAYALGKLKPTYPLPAKRYYCIAESGCHSSLDNPHCQSLGLSQCDYCDWSERGNT